MRVSCDKSDPGYANFRGYGVHKIFLDGVECKRTITADEELGVVVQYAFDAGGKHIVEGIGDDAHLKTEAVRGTVVIVTTIAVPQPHPRTDERPIKIAVAADGMVRDLR